MTGSPPNKAYKVSPFYNMTFLSILSLYQRDKLTEFLIRAHFGYNDISKMPKYKKGELLELMLNKIIESHSPIQTFSKYLNDKRIIDLEKLSITKGTQWSKNRIVLNVRIPIETQDLIAELGKGLETVGEVLEIAIATYIANCSNEYFEMIKFSFLNHISD